MSTQLRAWAVRHLCAGSFACAAFAAASPAAAQTEVASVGGWTIRDHRGHCSAETRQGGDLFAEIVYHAGPDETTLLLRGPAWSAIRERHGDAARLTFSNGRTYDGVAAAARRTGAGDDRVTTVRVSTDGGGLLTDFARAHRVDVSIGGAGAGTLSLRGTYAVAERLRRCAEASFRRYPPPTAVPWPPAGSQQPLARQPVHRSGTITNGDYPAAAIRGGEQGAVQVRLSVGPDGRVTGCTVTQSSGSSLLDSTTCSLAQRRFRYTPAGDANGNPVAATVTRTVVWRLPTPPPPPLLPPPEQAPPKS